MENDIDVDKQRYPFCIVWSPTPVLSWIIPFIGHIGIATSSGIIRDFPFPYRVREDRMAFGPPTKYWQLSKDKSYNGDAGWDAAVTEASHIYKKKMNYLFFGNCHSHVCKALNLMQYDGSTSWHPVKLGYLMFRNGKYVSTSASVRTWLPFAVFVVCLIIIITMIKVCI